MKGQGSAWEQRAERWLQRRGLTGVERNFRVRSGEIDLIMRDGDTLVFVEVRYRTRPHYGSGADSVTVTKQRRLISAAGHYLSRNPAFAERPCRFDVVSIQGGIMPRYQWIKDAFSAND